jgi:hypothetical protein
VKCAHCSARVDRGSWFCPNCKRSIPRRTPGPLGRVWLPVSIGLAALITVGVVGARWLRPQAPVDAEVNVREVAIVEITPAEEPVTPVEKGEPKVEHPKREDEPKQEEKEPVQMARAVEPELPVPALGPVGKGAISVSTDQPVRTFVYLNGGTLLGEAPLRNASIPAGKHTLVFWTPSLGGRSTRTVNVSPGQNVEVVESVRSKDSFKEDVAGNTKAPG